MGLRCLRPLALTGAFWLLCALGSGTGFAQPTGALTLVDAVRGTLDRQPDIQLQGKQVEIQDGAVQEAGGQFDLNLEAFAGADHADIPKSALDQLLQTQRVTDSTIYGTGVSRQFRNGVSVRPGVRVDRIDTDDPNYPTTNRTRVDFVVVVPLLKGLGRTAADAAELAAEREYQNSLLELRHTTSQALYRTIVSYWHYQAATQSLEQLRQSEERAERFIRELEKLIAGDERPAADLDQMVAERAGKTAARIAGEQRLVQARTELGLAMGLPSEQIPKLALPRDPFPPVQPRDIALLTRQAPTIADRAVHRRADYQALLGRRETGKILLEKARNNLLPQVDLNLKLGYSGLKEGNSPADSVQSYAENVPGLSAGAAVKLQWPFENNSARGRYRQIKAGYERIVISGDDLDRTIRSRVAVSVSEVEKASARLAKSSEAVRAYRQTVQNELTKYHMGIATLIDLTTVENQLIDASLKEIAAAADHAAAVATLRFETATLIAGEGEEASLDQSFWTTLPRLPME